MFSTSLSIFSIPIYIEDIFCLCLFSSLFSLSLYTSLFSISLYISIYLSIYVYIYICWRVAFQVLILKEREFPIFGNFWCLWVFLERWGPEERERER